MYKIIDICMLIIFIKEKNFKLLVWIMEWYVFRLHFIPWTVPQIGKPLSTVLGTSKYDIGIRNDSRNPLYLAGHFRRKFKHTDKKISFCGLKGVFVCQIHIIIQIVTCINFMVIENFWKGKNLDYYYVYVYVWCAIGLGIFVCVTEYYRKILNQTFQRGHGADFFYSFVEGTYV